MSETTLQVIDDEALAEAIEAWQAVKRAVEAGWTVTFGPGPNGGPRCDVGYCCATYATMQESAIRAVEMAMRCDAL